MQCEPVIAVEWSPNDERRGIYRRLLLRRYPGLKPGRALPAIECSGLGIVASSEKLAAYRAVCGDSQNETVFVPLLFPHAMLGSAHLLMLSHKSFPLGSMGMLHLRNHVVRYRPFGIDETWDMKCCIARQRTGEKGLEFDFDSSVSIGEEVVWRSVSTFFKRGTPSGRVEESPLANLFGPLASGAPNTTTFAVPADIGKQYARVTGDYNPIHVSSLAARLFGFKRAIAHGMWSIARAVNELPNIDGPVRLDVAFKGPMFVGSEAAIRRDDESHRFDVFCGKNPRPVINGVYRSTDRGALLL